MRKFVSIALVFAGFLIGCTKSPSQIPQPVPYQVALSWTAPVVQTGNSWPGCGTPSACTYEVYRETIKAGGTCDPATSTNWQAINATALASGTTYTDAAVPQGVTVCYDVETVQTGYQQSAPSNMVSIVVPATALAPTVASPTTALAKNDPALVMPKPGNSPIAGLQLVAKLERR